MENRISQIVKEELNKLSDKKELEQLDKLFDLTKIPQDQLDKQYYHFAIHDGFEGYGNPLMKTNEGKYILENEEKVYNASEVKDIISQKYNFEDWQFQVIRGANNIEVCLCVPFLNQDVKILTNDMGQLGYFFI